MKYNITKMVGDECVRYSLTNKGVNPLIVIGINPSTADKDKPDATMRRVMGFAERYGFDSFVMLTSIRYVRPIRQHCHKSAMPNYIPPTSAKSSMSYRRTPEPQYFWPMAATSIAVSTCDLAFATS